MINEFDEEEADVTEALLLSCQRRLLFIYLSLVVLLL